MKDLVMDSTPNPSSEMELLPIYTQPYLKCPKCGHVGTTQDKYIGGIFLYIGSEIADEKVARECKNCGYTEFFRPRDWKGTVKRV